MQALMETDGKPAVMTETVHICPSDHTGVLGAVPFEPCVYRLVDSGYKFLRN